MNVKKLSIFIGSILLSLSAGAIGSLATYPNIANWYESLAKPVLQPPNWVFAPVWTVLYVLMGVALYLVITAKSKQSKNTAYWLFGAQLALNTIWSLVFFGAHNLWLGLFIIVALLVAVGVTANIFAKFSKLACYLLIPYIAWICFATYLNLGVVILN